MWELIEQPPKEHRIAHYAAALRLDIAGQADFCAKWLRAQGLEVLRICKGPRIPRIAIRTSPLCDKIEGAVSVYERGLQGERRYKMVNRFDCEVWWIDTGGAA